MNKRLIKFYFYSAKYWKGKISRLNDIFIVSISFLFFLIKFLFCFSCFNSHSILYRFNDLFYRLNDIICRLNEIFFFDICSNFLVSISFLINIGKEMSLPEFRIYKSNKYRSLICRISQKPRNDRKIKTVKIILPVLIITLHGPSMFAVKAKIY